MTDHIFAEQSDGSLQFVGDFEGLYRSDPDPWQQAGEVGARVAYYAFSRARLAHAIAELYPSGCLGLEIGCGHGHALACVAEAVGGIWAGCDISMTAVRQARQRYPSLRFSPADIAHDHWPFMGSERQRYDVVILSQLLWYVLDRLDHALRNTVDLLRPGGVLVISQAFLREPQRYGAEIIDGFEGAIAAVKVRRPELRLVLAGYSDGAHGLAHNDGLIIFRKPEGNR